MTCPNLIELDVPRRPGNGLCIEVGTPLPRCKLRTPSHWPQNGPGAARWLLSGGSPLVFGPCCPKGCKAQES